MSEERTLFTTAEAAAMLGITPEAVRTAAWIGTLKVVKINPRLNMVTREAIEEYRREYLGRVGRPRKRRATTTESVPHAERDQPTHDTIQGGDAQTDPPQERE